MQVTPSVSLSVALALGLVLGGTASHRPVAAAQAQPSPSAPAPATPANAATFLGDWTLQTTGANGSSTSALSITVDAGKIKAELVSEVQGRRAISDIQKSGARLLLRYEFDYQGMPVPVVLTLTPDGEKLNVAFDFAGGGYETAGTGTKKK